MALPWLKPYGLMGRNTQSVLGMVCLLVWFVPVESRAQGSLWDDVKVMAGQVIRDKIKPVPTAVTPTLPTPQPVVALGDARTPTDDIAVLDRPVENTLGVGFRSTRDFVLEPSAVKRNVDNTLYLKIRVFNLTEADGVLEVFDESGKHTEFPKAILGNRRIPDSVYALVIDNQVKVGTGIVEYVMKGQSPLDPRSRFQSRMTELSLIVPPGGSFRITKASPYAIAYNLFFFGLAHVGYTDSDGSPISKKLMQDIVQTLAIESRNFIEERLATRTLTYPDLLDFGCELTLRLVGKVLKPENLDGRTLLGGALKKHLVEATPFLSQLDAVAKLGDAANWINTLANLRAARTQDTSIVINRGLGVVYAGDNEKSGLPGTNAVTAAGSAKTGSDMDVAHVVDNTTTGLSGDEAAQALGATTEYDRRNAIQQMVKHSSIRSPLSAKEVALIVKGTSGAARAQSIAALAKLIKQNLSGLEVATILGDPGELRDYDRRDAIQALAKEGKFGANGADAGLFLIGATGAARAQSIASFAKSLKPNLSGQEAATILGDPGELRDYDRRDAIRALAKEGKFGANGADAGLFLIGATGAARAQSIASFAKSLKPNLSGQEAAEILGGSDVLKEYDRRDAILALAESRRLRQGLSGDELAAMLNGATGAARAQSIEALAKRQ